jgi:DNA-binding HxlR family transcriptional regulator
MLGRTYENQVCSIARALEVVGERWTLLVIRDAFLDVRRFEQFQQSLGIARNVLTDRLNRLVEQGVLERARYSDHPERFEYQLTAKGRELLPVLLGLMHWGDRHQAGTAGPPRVAEHRDCGGTVTNQLACATCGDLLSAEQVTTRPGPGLHAVPAPGPAR